MNIILIENQELNGDEVVLEDHRASHIVKILRSEEGDTLKFGVIEGMRGEAEIVSIKRKYPHRVVLRVTLQEPPRPRSKIDLVLALPRPIMLKRILSQVTALGIGHLYLINANRVEKSFWESTLLEQGEYRKHLVSGLEQSVDTRLPTISIHNRFKPFAEDVLPERVEYYSHSIVADPSGNRVLAEAILPPANRILLAVGPEGGWVEYELEKFEKAGFTICTIGERILKVDTAVIALHGYISACFAKL